MVRNAAHAAVEVVAAGRVREEAVAVACELYNAVSSRNTCFVNNTKEASFCKSSSGPTKRQARSLLLPGSVVRLAVGLSASVLAVLQLATAG